MFGRQQFKFPQSRSYNENCSARKLFRPSLACTQPPTYHFSPPTRCSFAYVHTTHPHRVSLPSCTVSRSYLRGACSTGIVCVHVPSLPTSRVRHVNRAYRRHFFLDAKSTPAPPSTLQFHRSRRTDLFLGRDPLFLVGIRAARIKRWHISDLLPRATSIPPRVFLYFACFHSYAVYGRAETLHELRSSTRKIRRFLLLLVVGNDRWEHDKFISRICRTVSFQSSLILGSREMD